MPAKVTGRVVGGSVLALPVTFGPIKGVGRADVRFAPTLIGHQSWVNPAAAVTNGYVTAKTSTALPAAAGSVTFTRDGSLTVADFARNVVITVTHATAVVAASGVITGLNEYGETVTEAWSVTAGTASKTFTGLVAFKSVTSVTYVTATNAQANTIIVGSGNTLGLSFPCICPSAVKEAVDASVVTNGVVAAASTTANTDARGTYTPNSVPNAARDYDVWYLASDLQASY